MADDSAVFLGKAGHVKCLDVFPFKMRSEREYRGDRDDACAADSREYGRVGRLLGGEHGFGQRSESH